MIQSSTNKPSTDPTAKAVVDRRVEFDRAFTFLANLQKVIRTPLAKRFDTALKAGTLTTEEVAVSAENVMTESLPALSALQSQLQQIGFGPKWYTPLLAFSSTPPKF